MALWNIKIMVIKLLKYTDITHWQWFYFNNYPPPSFGDGIKKTFSAVTCDKNNTVNPKCVS